jgi:ABC-type multidrug transport system ATPase subunit
MQLVADRLQKKFGAITAVADVSFAATPGKVLGLLGPNGAGKSTTISMLAGLTKPRWAVDGFDQMTWRGLPLQSAFLPTAILVGWSALFAAIAVWRFDWEDD